MECYYVSTLSLIKLRKHKQIDFDMIDGIYFINNNSSCKNDEGIN